MPQGAGVYGVVYPQNLIDQKIQGDVWFSFVVDSTGQVRVDESLRVLLSDHPLLTQTARESIRDGKYRPALRQGRPVPVRVYQRVMYRLRD
jgi:TonB family protein